MTTMFRYFIFCIVPEVTEHVRGELFLFSASTVARPRQNQYKPPSSPDSLQVKHAVLFHSSLRHADEKCLLCLLVAHRVPSRRPQVVKNANRR